MSTEQTPRTGPFSYALTRTLDARITERTQTFWDGVWQAKKKGYDTMARLWPLQKPA